MTEFVRRRESVRPQWSNTGSNTGVVDWTVTPSTQEGPAGYERSFRLQYRAIVRISTWALAITRIPDSMLTEQGLTVELSDATARVARLGKGLPRDGRSALLTTP